MGLLKTLLWLCGSAAVVYGGIVGFFALLAAPASGIIILVLVLLISKLL